jgi:hypothetical protein
MSGFLTPLKVTPLPGGKFWQLLEGFEYVTDGPLDEYGTGPDVSGPFLIIVPAGFITDFASVPRVLWWLLPPWGNYGKAAVVHDLLYNLKVWSRGNCDHIFLEAMIDEGVSRKTRMTMYSFVRAFGWLAWNKKARAKAGAGEATARRIAPVNARIERITNEGERIAFA